jgi:choline dehydrogenase-like flavoprotein
MASSPEVVVIGSGIGGGTLANRLVQHGLNVTILERGGYLPQEPENWDVAAVFFGQKYMPQENWLDKEGTAFRPNYYTRSTAAKNVPRHDAPPLERTSNSWKCGWYFTAWPITYRQLAPTHPRRLYLVHAGGCRSTEPRTHAYPFPASITNRH